MPVLLGYSRRFRIVPCILSLESFWSGLAPFTVTVHGCAPSDSDRASDSLAPKLDCGDFKKLISFSIYPMIAGPAANLAINLNLRL
jgi:hypothetical protein